MKPNEEVRQLSRKFGIRVKQMRIVQNGVYRVKTVGEKQFCLKRMPYPPAQLRWIDVTLRRLKRVGNLKLAWRNPRMPSGQRLYARTRFEDNPPFVLVPWIRGRFPSAHSYREVYTCGVLLAKFHQVSRKINIPTAGKPSKLGSWPDKLQTEQQHLNTLIRKAKANTFQSGFDRLLQQHGAELSQMVADSLNMLRRSRYSSYCAQAKSSLCHGDFGPTNLLYSRKGIYMIDFESLCIDLRAFDLYKAIYNFCHQHHWHFAIARSFLNGYQSVNKLQTQDYEMLRIWLRFPREMCKLIQHYEHTPAMNEKIMKKEFLKVLTHERNRSQFLRKLDAYAR